MRSSQAACWIEPGQMLTTFGDYIHLTVLRHSELAMAAWLSMVSGGPLQPPPSSPCALHGTTLLT